MRQILSAALLVAAALWVMQLAAPVAAQPLEVERPVARILAAPKINVVFRLPDGTSLRAMGDKLPRTLPVYNCSVDRAAGDKVAGRLLETLSLRGQLKTQEEGLLGLVDGSTVVERRDVSGSLFFADRARLWSKIPAPGQEAPQGLSDRSARTAALDFLTKIGAPLGKDDIVSVSRDTIELTKAGQSTPQVVPGPVQVSVRPKLSGLPVLGPGGKMKVFFDAGGEVAGCFVVMRKASPDSKGARRLKPLADAAAGLQRFPLDHLTLVNPDRIEIRNVSMAYYARSALDRQTILQPVYVFDGVAYGSRGKKPWEVPYRQFVAALAQPPEAIWGPPGKTLKAEPRTKIQVPGKGEDE